MEIHGDDVVSSGHAQHVRNWLRNITFRFFVIVSLTELKNKAGSGSIGSLCFEPPGSGPVIYLDTTGSGFEVNMQKIEEKPLIF
jgi:hypothetical protein